MECETTKREQSKLVSEIVEREREEREREREREREGGAKDHLIEGLYRKCCKMY